MAQFTPECGRPARSWYSAVTSTGGWYLLCMPSTDVTTLIRTELPRLAGSLRKVGELILEDPAAVTHCSAAELGRRTGTSQATVTRFCRAIGLDSYQHLLIELAQERGRGESSEWGSAEIGWSSAVEKKEFPKEVNRSGAVSPAIRATATSAAVTIPGSAVRRTMTTEVRRRMPHLTAMDRTIPQTTAACGTMPQASARCRSMP